MMNIINCPRCGTELLLSLARKPEKPWPWDTPIRELKVNTRGRQALERDKLWDPVATRYTDQPRFPNAGAVDTTTDEELLRLPEFGKASLCEVREAIRRLKEEGT